MSLKKEYNKTIYLLENLIKSSEYKRYKNQYFFENYSETKRLILFFVPDGSYRVSGGILSICTMYKILKELKKLHNCDVIASYLPNKKDHDFKYRNFENEMIIYNFDEIVTNLDSLDYIQVHIPEIMVASFMDKEKKLKLFFNYIEKIPKKELNILNQNDLFVPKIEYLNFIKSRFDFSTMTIAHKQYATIEKRKEYDLPLHLLSPWLNPVPYKVRSYKEKENLIIYSPDKIQWIPNGSELTKVEIINRLKLKLPNYKFVEILNIKYDEYKDLASKAKFAITFGEGLDGYFTETVFSGGVSFAVYNEFFFTEEYKNLNTLFKSFNELNETIVDKIIVLDNEIAYKKAHNEISTIINKTYSLNHLENDLIEFYTKKYDFQ